MFPEFREEISRLKIEDARFSKLFHRHNALDQEIKNSEAGLLLATQGTIETLKKEKLHLKDELYGILLKSREA